MLTRINKPINKLIKTSTINSAYKYASLVNPHWINLNQGFNKLQTNGLQTQTIDEETKLKYLEKIKARAKEEGFDSVEAFIEHYKKKQAERESEETKATIDISKAKENSTSEAKKYKAKENEESLNNIMKLELLEGLDKEKIGEIWREYHSQKSYLSAIIPKETYKLQYDRSNKFPRFVIPIPRGDGVEFFYVQSEYHKVYFTSLLEYKTHLDQATPHLIVSHYPELSNSKDIVLMRGELVTADGASQPKLKLDEAQLLSLIYQKFYVLGTEEKLELVRKFNEEPESFDYHELMAQVNQLD